MAEAAEAAEAGPAGAGLPTLHVTATAILPGEEQLWANAPRATAFLPPEVAHVAATATEDESGQPNRTPALLPAEPEQSKCKRKSRAVAPTAPIAPDGTLADMRHVIVSKPQELPNRGTVGDFLLNYRAAHEMPHPTAYLTRDQQREQEEARAEGFEGRMRAMFEEANKRKLLLKVCTPEAYNYAVYVNSMAQRSQQQQINYVFAETMRILRGPSGMLTITHDAEVAAGLVNAGYEEQGFEQVKSTIEMHKMLTEKEDDRLREEAVQRGRAARVEIEGAASSSAHARLRAPRDETELAIDDLPAEEVVGDVAAVLQAHAQPVNIPTALTKGFRAHVFGPGNVDQFGPRLRAAVEDAVTWQEAAYSPLKLWTSEACRKAWAGAEEKQRDAWEQTVMETLQAYCLLRRLENNEAVCQASELAEAVGKIRDGTASFTVIRKACKTLTKVPGGAPEGNYRDLATSLLP